MTLAVALLNGTAQRDGAGRSGRGWFCPVVAHHVGSLRRNDTSGVGGEADMARTSLNRRD